MSVLILAKNPACMHCSPRRLIRLSLLAALVLSIVLICSAPKIIFASSQQPYVFYSIEIESGDTLWDLAVRYCPENESVRSYMDQIRSINHLSAASAICAGEYLIIPVEQVP